MIEDSNAMEKFAIFLAIALTLLLVGFIGGYKTEYDSDRAALVRAQTQNCDDSLQIPTSELQTTLLYHSAYETVWEADL